MRQLLQSFWEGTEKNALLLCKIAWKTIWRYGIAGMLFLTVGLCLAFPAYQSCNKLRQERAQPCELLVQVLGNVQSLESILQIDEVRTVSPVMNLEGTVIWGEYQMLCPILAVFSSYPKVDLVEGVLFPEESNMVCLMLNRAAAAAYFKEEATMTVSVNETVDLVVGGKAQKALICGIFDDNSENPLAYMSYQVAEREYQRTDPLTLLVSLNYSGEKAKIMEELRTLNLMVSKAPEEKLRWDLMAQQAWQLAGISGGFVICGAILLREKRKTQRRENNREAQMLLLGGLTTCDLQIIEILRLGMMLCGCFLVAVLIVWIV